MEEEEPTRKTSLRRFLRGSDKKSSPAKSPKGVPDSGPLASSSSFPTSAHNNFQLKGNSTGSAQATPHATPPHKKHHFGLLLKRDLHLHNFFNRHNSQNSRRFSPPATEQSPLSVEASPTPAEAELSRALNQLNSVTRSGRLASSSSSGGFHTNLLGKCLT